jgi:hypothetical protein
MTEGNNAEDGDSLTGRWEWTEDSEEMAYDATMTRVEDR